MVDVARLIMDNLFYILIAAITLVGIGLAYLVYKREKGKSTSKEGEVKQEKIPTELTKMTLPTQEGIKTKGKLEQALANSQKKKQELEKTKKEIGMRRRPVRRRTRKARNRRTRKRSTRKR